jgi:pimeloyl-ACP methyl ester carboxylesterase
LLADASTAGAVVTRNGRYVDVDGLHVYYEVHGQGAPLVLLHGGGVSLESFDSQVPEFAQRYQVIVPERMGHGRTADANRPFHYHTMAEETVDFLNAIGVTQPVDVLGWSDGGIIGLDLAMHHPERVHRLVVTGTNFTTAGIGPPPPGPGSEKFAAGVDSLMQEAAAVTVGGDSEREAVMAKLSLMWSTEPDYTTADLATIHARTLVMVGDHDLVRPEHAVAMYRAIPGAELAILPGASHLAPIEKPDLFNRLVLDFLAEP